MTAPTVSVVIPTYNRKAMLLDCIRSVLAQTLPAAEILVIDDGSTDGSAEAAEPLHDTVRVILQENQGPSAARNRGFREAKGAWIALLDSDDLWHPFRLESQLQLVETYPELEFVFGDVQLEVSGKNEPRTFLQSKKNYKYLSSREGVIPEVFSRLFLESFIPTSTVLISSSLREQIGEFDTRLWSVEDREFWLRAAEVGSVGFVNRVLATKRVGDLNLGADEELRAESLLRVLESWKGRVDADLLAEAFGQAYYLLGSQQLKRGKFAEARKSLGSARAASWKNPKFWAKFLIATGRGLVSDG